MTIFVVPMSCRIWNICYHYFSGKKIKCRVVTNGNRFEQCGKILKQEIFPSSSTAQKQDSDSFMNIDPSSYSQINQKKTLWNCITECSSSIQNFINNPSQCGLRRKNIIEIKIDQKLSKVHHGSVLPEQPHHHINWIWFSKKYRFWCCHRRFCKLEGKKIWFTLKLETVIKTHSFVCKNVVFLMIQICFHFILFFQKSNGSNANLTTGANTLKRGPVNVHIQNICWFNVMITIFGKV